MIQFILKLWQLPQYLVALVCLLTYKMQKRAAKPFKEKGSKIYVIENHPSGVSFGPIIFVRENYKLTVCHELGHSKQSRMLGPLYLLVIGLPSLIHFWWWNPTCKHDYYHFWCEKWADKLGGVYRPYTY